MSKTGKRIIRSLKKALKGGSMYVTDSSGLRHKTTLKELPDVIRALRAKAKLRVIK